MTFLLRQLSRTADGRDIVRATRIERDTVTIGRAAGCDIVVPDLAVAPRHAVVARDGARRITVTVEAGFTVGIDGRSASTGAIDVARGGELVVGDARIMVARDVDGATVLTVTRAAGDAAPVDERVFSLAHVLPGKRPMAWALIATVLALFLAWPVWHFTQAGANPPASRIQADRSWTPGPLSAAHHGLEGNCRACHVQAFVAVRDSACVSCHKQVHDHAPPARLSAARAPLGVGERFLDGWAKAFNKPGRGACVDCHREHDGAGAMPPTPQVFCADCHTALKNRLADAKIGNAGDFGTAHPQFRPLVALAPGTKPVLGRGTIGPQLHEANGLKFPHALHLDGRGGVAQMARTLKGQFGFGDALACADCHKPTADGARFMPVDMERDCKMCHSLGFDRIGGTVRTLRHGDIAQMIADLRAMYRSTGPDRPLELGGMARRRPGQYAQGQVYHAYFGAAAIRPDSADAAIRQVFSPGGACYDCHVVTPPGTSGSIDWGVVPVRQPARYLMHGWFDHAAHTTQSCASCHAAAKSRNAADVLVPGIETCRSCHGGEGSAAKVPSSCAMCHSYHQKQDAPWRSRRRLSPAAPPAPVLPGGGRAS
ncbi:cytochrome c3 family protein [Sphingomonas sp. RT2P30]|uniref:cytochrome c3 family protein n=1 Tax=Parasphingomonas halimpatiens TaxID=3096162 RepID=UPI002FCAA014